MAVERPCSWPGRGRLTRAQRRGGRERPLLQIQNEDVGRARVLADISGLGRYQNRRSDRARADSRPVRVACKATMRAMGSTLCP